MSQNNRSEKRAQLQIREAIQRIARHRIVSPDGVVEGTDMPIGYVAKIHTEGDYAGTIDVQEYDCLPMADNDEKVKNGYHQYVLLSAIQGDSKGYVIIPKLYSQVTLALDPKTNTEYVAMFSHVDVIQLDSHDTITVGVQEREEYDTNDEDGRRVHELEPTGVFTKTTYKKDSIITEVQGDDDANNTQYIIDSKKIQGIVGDDKSSINIDQEQIHLKHDKAETILDDEQHTSKVGDSAVKITDGTVYLGSDSSTDDAVLGVELANILSEMLGYIGQIMTTTMMGPQPTLNLASFIQLKAKVDAYKSSHSGFLTKKVQVQKG